MMRPVLSNRVLPLCASALLLALSGCATPRSEVRVDKADADLSKCRTFDWRPVSSDAASFTDQRVRAAALKRLEDKGYTLATDKPDCQITYVLSTQDQPKPKPSVGVGVGGGCRSAATRARSERSRSTSSTSRRTPRSGAVPSTSPPRRARSAARKRTKRSGSSSRSSRTAPRSDAVHAAPAPFDLASLAH